jgi:hypothetical protein
MTLATTLLFLHVLTAIWTIAGLLGRWVVLGAAARSGELTTMRSILRIGDKFERGMVQPGSLAILATGLALAWVQDQPLLGFLQGSGANWLLVSLLLYLTSIPLVGLVFIPRARRFELALAGATEQATVTASLRSAFADRAVLAGHVYELAIVFLILGLMITQAF